LVAKGEISLEISVPAQGSLEVDFVRTGDFLPGVGLTGSRQRRFDARALGPVEAFAFDGARLRVLCEQDHELGYQLLEKLARAIEVRLSRTQLRLLEMSALEAA
jgi:CRP-like cAMP-binding protein